LVLVSEMVLSSGKDGKPKKGNIIGRYLQSHVLGIMARLADVINDPRMDIPPVQEQKRCIRAIEETVKICKEYARIARPQVYIVYSHENFVLGQPTFC
jgi:serine/threonine-protein kinase ATR